MILLQSPKASKALKYIVALGTIFFPLLAQAHPLGGTAMGWHDGFRHPFHGWDHLIAMIAVGVWAAQQRGRGVWLVPATFVGVMAIGGMVGASGIHLAGSEWVIMASILILAWLIVRRVRLSPKMSACLVGTLAFFHGFAHGQEMPASASLLTFGIGFSFATLLLHGAGLATARLASLGLVCLIGAPARAQIATNPPSTSARPGIPPQTEATVQLPTMIVQGRGDSLIGVAESASQGTVGALQLEDRPTLRSGEILETVPGVIITQHAGGGKANQYFLRGFNLDHGTDFASSLDGMPINMPSHGHGQGYTDMNIVIPELVQRVNYQKGVYDAENGDFSSAGAAHLETFKLLPQTLAIVEGGMYGYGRAVFASSPKVGNGNLLYAVELYHDDGPWKNPDDYQKFNGLLTYSQGSEAQGFSVTFRGYHGRWDSSDQVAASAVDDGLVPFFGSLDNTTGGNSQRYSLQGEWHRSDDSSATRIMAYGFYYDLDLFSNFTYYLTDTNRGDQFEQTDQRLTGGLQASHTLFSQWWGRDVENTVGLQVRSDGIRNGLFNTQARQRMDKTQSADGSTLPAVTRQDDILETSAGLYYENKVHWGEKFRSVAGIRGDFFNFDVSSTRPENSDDRFAGIASPKLSLIFGPWLDTEFYVEGGLGFHSNDARGATTRVDPVTGSTIDADGNPIQRADPLVRTYGAEVGVRTLALKGLQSTLSLWWLDIDSELVFAGDAGTTEASRPSRRYGVEWANFYKIAPALTLDADVSFSHSEFRDSAPEGRDIPGSIESVVSAGITYTSDFGFFSSLRLRYFGPRPLIEDDSFRSGETILLNLQVGYRFNERWQVSAEVFNLLNRRDHDIDYAYESRVTPLSRPETQIHFHPVEPIQARIALTARF